MNDGVAEFVVLIADENDRVRRKRCGSRKCKVGEERTRLPHHQLRRQASGPVRLRDAGGKSSPNPCPGGGRKSGLIVADRVTMQIEDALFFEARYVRSQTADASQFR